ncbi:hypothetical protein T07_5244 [Trichinella nelsoni]|uniref:Uncharacterized protein n=1 Tax=Trichinella nelsoni TaxID=6336 RepID=A0A0V0RX06_9BILA|nr:hypothetical protein T07_5244 [Trichinella nelsoni]
MDEFKELLWMNNGFYLTLPILFASIQHRPNEAVRDLENAFEQPNAELPSSDLLLMA